MNQISTLLSVGLAVALSVSCTGRAATQHQSAERLPQAGMSADEAEVRRLHAAYFPARVARDTAFLARLLAPEFLMVTAGDGRLWHRAEALTYLGQLDYDSVHTDSVRIALHGATAVATGLTLVWGRTRSGSPIRGPSGAPPGRYRGTLVFSRRGSDWRLLASQGTLVH